MIIQKIILSWYGEHTRDLPWRRTHDPYRILVSEVMLQQTQVDRVISKYKEFLKLFPTVQALSIAKTSDVIRAWAGLGYNRRALYLQRTAQGVVRDFGGKFPQDIDTLKTLPGIGDYTARAILSFAFQESVPMMDTNHRRFYQRVFFGMRKKDDRVLLKKAEEVISFVSPKKIPHVISTVATQEERSGEIPIRTLKKGISRLRFGSARNDTSSSVYDWNQALMDFGSLVCTSKKPKCEICPIQKYCKAYPRVLAPPPRRGRLGGGTSGLRKKGKDAGLLFRQTDRYMRGRIVELLRNHGKINATQLQKELTDFTPDRIRTIVIQLEKDGLITSKNNVILLP